MKINRILIAGTHSGCGKTTVSCAILRALQNRKMNVNSFKCGPDYIDPMFHSEVVGTKSRNIDMFLCSRKIAKYLFAKNSGNDENSISVLEGVMGYYDGMGGNSTQNSSYDISNELSVPTVLVVDAKGASLSLVATILGYKNYKKNNIQAVILNNVSKMMLPLYKDVIESETGLKVLGSMPKEPKAAIESRHLGLITAKEIDNLNQKIDMLGNLAEENINLDELVNIAKSADDFEFENITQEKIVDVKIAVAQDKAFCFYYQDALNSLEEMGASLVPFSPIYDEKIPEDVQGIIFGGGYPELYIKELSENKSMLKSIRKAHEQNMPIYGECGGFMYLGKEIENHEMCAIIDMKSEMTKRLQNFGYTKLKPLDNSSLIDENKTINAHEFHYSKSDIETFCFEAEKSSGKKWKAGFAQNNVFAQYPHIHFSGEIDFAKNFLLKCEEFKLRLEK